MRLHAHEPIDVQAGVLKIKISSKKYQVIMLFPKSTTWSCPFQKVPRYDPLFFQKRTRLRCLFQKSTKLHWYCYNAMPTNRLSFKKNQHRLLRISLHCTTETVFAQLIQCANYLRKTRQWSSPTQNASSGHESSSLTWNATRFRFLKCVLRKKKEACEYNDLLFARFLKAKKETQRICTQREKCNVAIVR